LIHEKSKSVLGPTIKDEKDIPFPFVPITASSPQGEQPLVIGNNVGKGSRLNGFETSG